MKINVLRWVSAVLITGSVLSSSVLFAESKEKEKKQKVEKYPWTLGYKPDKKIIFSKPAEGKPLKLDVFLPKKHQASEKRGCVILFFGGGWSSGDPSQFYGYSKYFASRGLVAISAQYRTMKSHKAKPRQCVEDGKEAIRYVRAHAEELGIDPDKIIVGGGSAGGHVAAATAMCPKIDALPESEISCVANAVMLFNPVYDNGPEGYGYERVKGYWKDISPMHNIRAGQPPVIVFFGESDTHISVKQINTFQQKMEEAGNDSQTHIFAKAEHGFFHISKGGRKMFENVLKKADAFLVQNEFLTGENRVMDWTAESVVNFSK